MIMIYGYIYGFVCLDVCVCECKLRTISEANKYCLKPSHGIYGLNNCPQIKGIYPLVGIKKSDRNHTLNFTIDLVSSSCSLKCGLPPLKNMGLIFSSFILGFFFFSGTLSSIFFPHHKQRKRLGMNMQLDA